MVSDEPLPPLARSALQRLSLSLSLACVAGYLYHQKDMLQDRGRMDGYRNAILQNPGCFKDKVVLDVGTGSGVLAIWAAMAGAKRVYAVEATSMAQQARKLVAQNGFQEVVVVLEGYMEQVELPEKARHASRHRPTRRVLRWTSSSRSGWILPANPNPNPNPNPEQVDIIVSEWMGNLLREHP